MLDGHGSLSFHEVADIPSQGGMREDPVVLTNDQTGLQLSNRGATRAVSRNTLPPIECLQSAKVQQTRGETEEPAQNIECLGIHSFLA